MDIVSYILGQNKSKKDGDKSTVIIKGTGYNFTDANKDGNIVIEEDE